MESEWESSRWSMLQPDRTAAEPRHSSSVVHAEGRCKSFDFRLGLLDLVIDYAIEGSSCDLLRLFANVLCTALIHGRNEHTRLSLDLRFRLVRLKLRHSPSLSLVVLTVGSSNLPSLTNDVPSLSPVHIGS